ncbi:MAG: DUF2497 domain-containing protein [Sphingomonadales bacterium]|nr:MAG: DUF2497 domain-containing protein [Sphingomonadales bacterium]
MSAAESKEPSMEEILASIRRIISEEGEGAPAPSPIQDTPQPDPFDDLPEDDEVLEDAEPEVASEVLELTTFAERAKPSRAPMMMPPPQAANEAPLVSDETLAATNQYLNSLSGMLMRNYAGAENTLEGVVREMLRPMLKEWLDRNLPDIVEQMVAREISRIAGGGGR